MVAFLLCSAVQYDTIVYSIVFKLLFLLAITFELLSTSD